MATSKAVSGIVTRQHISEFWNVGIATAQGFRQSMEDSYAIDLEVDPQTGLLAVFDGHGGAHCATHCSDNLVSTVRATDSWQKGDLHNALEEAFLALDHQLVRDDSAAPCCCGTTGTVALVRGDKLVVAGVGDSKAVLVTGGKAVPMTVDHKPTEPEEEARIRSAGGFVIRGRVNACLNVSRALGDAQFKTDLSRSLKEQQVSPAPDVRDATVTSTSDFLLLCSDGVWNSMRDVLALRFVRRRLRAGMSLDKICEELCAACLEPCRTAYDNITVVLCTFTDSALEAGAAAAGAAQSGHVAAAAMSLDSSAPSSCTSTPTVSPRTSTDDGARPGHVDMNSVAAGLGSVTSPFVPRAAAAAPRDAAGQDCQAQVAAVERAGSMARQGSGAEAMARVSCCT